MKVIFAKRRYGNRIYDFLHASFLEPMRLAFHVRIFIVCAATLFAIESCIFVFGKPHVGTVVQVDSPAVLFSSHEDYELVNQAIRAKASRLPATQPTALLMPGDTFRVIENRSGDVRAIIETSKLGEEGKTGWLVTSP